GPLGGIDRVDQRDPEQIQGGVLLAGHQFAVQVQVTLVQIGFLAGHTHLSGIIDGGGAWPTPKWGGSVRSPPVSCRGKSRKPCITLPPPRTWECSRWECPLGI